MTHSEIARLRQRIADEYLAAQWGLTGLASGTSQHHFITARMENMGESFTQLTRLIGSPEEAIQMVNDTLEQLPDTPTRYTLLDFLQREFDHTEETTRLIKHIQEMWETMDLLRVRFGSERARKIIEAASSFTTEKEDKWHE
jgi:hypothetical protein